MGGMMTRPIIFLSVLFTCQTAAAEVPAPISVSEDQAAPAWQATATIGAGFNAARLPDGSAQDVVDESEHAVAIELVKADFLRKGWPLRFKAGATYSPQAFDDQDPSSATYVQIGLGDNAIGLASETAFGKVWAKYDGKIKPFLRFRHTDAQRGFLDGHKRYDDSLTGGFAFTSNAPQYCRADAGGKANFCKSDWKISLGADVARNWSSDPTQRYWQVKASAKGQSPSIDFGPAVNFFSSFEGARRAFDSVTGVAIDRRDWSFKTSGGIESQFTIYAIAFSAVAGVRYQVRDSNIAVNDHRRTYGFGGLDASIKF